MSVSTRRVSELVGEAARRYPDEWRAWLGSISRPRDCRMDQALEHGHVLVVPLCLKRPGVPLDTSGHDAPIDKGATMSIE